MIRLEKIECWMFQLKQEIPDKVLRELKGWVFDSKFNELLINADDILDERVEEVNQILVQNDIAHQPAKLYRYGRIYVIVDYDSLGEEYDEMEIELTSELYEEDYYYDFKDKYYLVRFNPNYEDVWIYGYAERLDKEYKKREKEVQESKRQELEWEKLEEEKRKREEERIEKLRKEYEEKRQKELKRLKTLEQVPLSLNSVVVRGPKLRCQMEHTVKEMAGKVFLMNDEGEVKEDLVPIKYCIDEDAFFMLDVDYKELKYRGRLLCKVITYRQYDTSGLGSYTYDQLEPESKLKIMGYTVAKNKGLSQERRLNILEGAIAYGIMTKDEIVSHLRWCYIQHRNIHPEAAQKYIEDIEYLQYADIEQKEIVDIDEIIE